MASEGGFDRFREARGRLASTMADLAAVLGELGAKERAARLADASAQMESDAFNLMVVGEFKRGKSTTINAMLGADILPAKVAPCTGLITKVRYGTVPRARLYPHEPGGKPLEVPAADLRKYVVIEDMDDAVASDTPGVDDVEGETAAGNAIAGLPYSHIDLEYPLDLCRNGVVIIDSPGLNEHRTRTRIALDYLYRADAVAVVLSCQQALSKSELAFIDGELGGHRLRHVFFLWNHFDTVQADRDEVAELERRSEKFLSPRLDSPDRVFYLSARSALLGRKNGLAGEVERSGFPVFEAALERFLASERGRVKVYTPLHMAENVVKEAIASLLPRRRALLEAPLKELEARYAAQKPKLEEAERQRERMLRSVERRRDGLVLEAAASYRSFVAGLEPEMRKCISSIDISAWDVLKDQKKIQARIGEALRTFFQERTRAWQERDLTPLLETHCRALVSEIDEQARSFQDNLDEIVASLTPDLSFDPFANRADDKRTASERFMGAVGGLFSGDFGSLFDGMSVVAEQLTKGFSMQIAIVVGLIVAGFGMPVILMALVGAGLYKTMSGSKVLMARIEDRAVSGVMAGLKKEMPHVEEEIMIRAKAIFERFRERIDAATRIRIDEVTSTVEAALAERKRGEEAIAGKLADLDALRTRIEASGRTLREIRAGIEN